MNRNTIFALISALLGGCATLLTYPEKGEKIDRLEFFPTTDLPVSGALRVSWDPHRIPFIDAEKDDDVPLALGLVHAHLRTGQLELLRHLSQGRLSELVGPFTVDIDHALRILDFSRAARTTIAAMSPEARRWAERFLSGLNLYFARNAARIPSDLRALGVSEITPWSLDDLVTVWKLASIDVNWGVYLQVLRIENESERENAWKLIQEIGAQSVPSVSEKNLSLGELLFQATKIGSNSYVVGKKKSRSGHGLIANDPHLGLMLPNTWLIAGFRSPSYDVIGLMIPSLPFVALGRNRSLAWGGTNMWGLSTHLYALTDAELRAVHTSESVIRVRGWFNQKVKVRFSELGPVISDAPLFRGKLPPTALKWMGHDASDEVSAFLAANRASTLAEFRAAFKDYAVSAQNLLVADREGNIGHLLAYRQPVPPNPDDRSLRQSSGNAWRTFHRPTDLPFVTNPKNGFLASANNKPFDDRIMGSHPAVGWFFQSNDRIDRLTHLLGNAEAIDVKTLMRFQRDTYSPSAARIREALARSLKDRGEEFGASSLWAELARWDGLYLASARGPVAFECLLSELAPAVFRAAGRSESAMELLLRSAGWKSRFLHDFAALDRDEARADLITQALPLAQAKFDRYSSWGEMHRLAAAHPLANLPVVGSRYRLDEFAVDGGSDTLMKTAANLNGEKSSSSYGTNARHISDLSDPDENYFVLFGGQDGWLVSAHTNDQTSLWREGKYIRLPLSPAGREIVFDRTLILHR